MRCCSDPKLQHHGSEPLYRFVVTGGLELQSTFPSVDCHYGFNPSLCARSKISVGLDKVSPDHSSLETENWAGVPQKLREFHRLILGILSDDLSLDTSNSVGLSHDPKSVNDSSSTPLLDRLQPYYPPHPSRILHR